MPERLSEAEQRTLEGLLRRLAGRGAELPPVLFRFVTEIVATPNIDLLVHDEAGRVLLSWRADAFGSGWHVPGSIIRHREEIAHRLDACAADEFGCALVIDLKPRALVQIFDDRGHSVSICHLAMLAGTPGQRIVGADETPRTGDLCWFEALPERLYPSHLVYRAVIEAWRADRLGGGIAVFTQHVGERDAAQESADGAIGAEMGLDRLS